MTTDEDTGIHRPDDDRGSDTVPTRAVRVLGTILYVLGIVVLVTILLLLFYVPRLRTLLPPP